MKIKVKKLKEKAKLPSYHHPGDVGMDLYSMEEVTVKPGEHYRFWHGFAMEFPEGYNNVAYDVRISNTNKNIVVKLIKAKGSEHGSKKESAVFHLLKKTFPKYPVP